MRFDDNDIGWLANLLAETAASEIMTRFRRLDIGDIREKTSATDLVTEADVNAERAITRALNDKFPGALVVGEEAHAEDPSILPGLGAADIAFVIDPVDGTINFASGLPLFGVMLAVVSKGETVAGMIYDPVGRDFVIGARGAGSHVLRSDGRQEPCRVAPAAPIASMVGAMSWNNMKDPERSTVARNQSRFFAGFNYRCAAVEYRLLVTGAAHFVVYNKLMPWDHLAGALIHSEAGGYSARFDGSAYLPSHVSGGLIAAPDQDSWQAIRTALELR